MDFCQHWPCVATSLGNVVCGGQAGARAAEGQLGCLPGRWLTRLERQAADDGGVQGQHLQLEAGDDGPEHHFAVDACRHRPLIRKAGRQARRVLPACWHRPLIRRAGRPGGCLQPAGSSPSLQPATASMHAPLAAQRGGGSNNPIQCRGCMHHSPPDATVVASDVMAQALTSHVCTGYRSCRGEQSMQRDVARGHRAAQLQPEAGSAPAGRISLETPGHAPPARCPTGALAVHARPGAASQHRLLDLHTQGRGAGGGAAGRPFWPLVSEQEGGKGAGAEAASGVCDCHDCQPRQLSTTAS